MVDVLVIVIDILGKHVVSISIPVLEECHMLSRVVINKYNCNPTKHHSLCNTKFTDSVLPSCDDLEHVCLCHM